MENANERTLASFSRHVTQLELFTVNWPVKRRGQLWLIWKCHFFQNLCHYFQNFGHFFNISAIFQNFGHFFQNFSYFFIILLYIALIEYFQIDRLIDRNHIWRSNEQPYPTHNWWRQWNRVGKQGAHLNNTTWSQPTNYNITHLPKFGGGDDWRRRGWTDDLIGRD